MSSQLPQTSEYVGRGRKGDSGNRRSRKVGVLFGDWSVSVVELTRQLTWENSRTWRREGWKEEGEKGAE